MIQRDERRQVYQDGGTDVTRLRYIQMASRGDDRQHIPNVFVGMAKGKLAYGDRNEYKADMVNAAKTLNPMDKVDAIEAPILFTVGSADNVTTPDSCKALYEKATPPKKWALIDGADHGFSEHRLATAEKSTGVAKRKPIGWLRTRCPSGNM